MASVQEDLNKCQQDMVKLDEEVYNSGFWKEIKLIKKLGVGILTNELKIEVVGDTLQLIEAENQPSDLYNKSKKNLLSNGLILIHEKTFKNSENHKSNLSIFKKPKYYIENIQENRAKLQAQYRLVSNHTYDCINKIVNPEIIQKLISDNKQKKIILTENFYNNYPDLRKDKIIEKIFEYQRDKYVYSIDDEQKYIIKKELKFYDDKTKKLLTDIFYSAMKDAYIKSSGVELEMNGLYTELNHWKDQLNRDINNMMYYTYDAVDGDSN